MAFDFRDDLSTREGFIEAIEEAARYIADHAESLLGDYPSGLNELTITAVFDFATPPCIDVKRSHFVLPPEKYPAQAERARFLDLFGILREESTEEPGETPGILKHDGQYA